MGDGRATGGLQISDWRFQTEWGQAGSKERGAGGAASQGEDGRLRMAGWGIADCQLPIADLVG